MDLAGCCRTLPLAHSAGELFLSVSDGGALCLQLRVIQLNYLFYSGHQGVTTSAPGMYPGGPLV